MSIYRRAGPRGIVWYIRWWAGGREHREAAGPTKAHAVALLARRRLESAERRKGLHLGGRGMPTVAEILSSYIRNAEDRGRRSTDTMKRKAAHVQASALANRRADQLTVADIEAYARARLAAAKKPAPATVNRELAVLRAALRWVAKRGDIPAWSIPPIQMLREPPGRVRVLSAEEERRLLDACPPRLRLVVLIALNTGMRRGEILGLRWRDIDLEHGFIRVERSAPGGERGTKSGARRDVPMNRALRAIFGTMDRGAPDALVIATESGKPYRNLARDFALARARADLTDFRFHDTRHTAASRVAMSGGTLLDIRDLLGHTTTAMAERYSHLMASRIREAVDRIATGATGQKTGSRRRTGRRGRRVTPWYRRDSGCSSAW